MKNNSRLLLVALWCVAILAGSAQAQQFEQKPLREALNPDGTLREGASGSFSTQGYQMQTDKNGRPRFVPNGSASLMSTPGSWDTQFTLSNGVSGTVVAIATDGVGNWYVGGIFGAVGSTVVNNIARFSTSTNTWSALGTGNGVNSDVRALAVSGSEVFVGGSFTQANVGGTVVAANRVARFSTNTNTWSALGTGGGNGVNSTVSALAVVGSDIFVGGFFTQANVGGTVVNANRVARFNTGTNTWSALGTGGGNGVNNGVLALAVSGTEVFVGGQFSQANVGAGTTIASSFIGRWFGVAAPAATNTQNVSTNGLFTFPPTGVSIFFTGVGGSGTCTVNRFDAPASNVSFSGATPANQSQYRFVITATGFTFSNAELRFNRTQIPNAGVTNVATVNVFRRPTPGTGAFSVLPNAFSAGAPDEVRATTTGFSEFILGSGADNPLPVELSAFTGKQENGRVMLAWTTQSERNNAGFEVQRMENGENWRVLGFVKGNGTTSQSQSYSFVDRTALGKVSYRLKQIDFDGQFEILPTIEVNAGVPRTFELGQNYPNPFNPSTVISYQLPVSGQVSLKVYDMLGREVATLVNTRQEAGRYQTSFNAASLSSGVYFYRLQAGTFVQTNKMMLVK